MSERTSGPENFFVGDTALLLKGKFEDFRSLQNHRDDPEEMYFMLNRLHSIWSEYTDPAIDKTFYPNESECSDITMRFLHAEQFSKEYYLMLFKMLREAKFGIDDRPAIETYFRNIQRAHDDAVTNQRERMDDAKFADAMRNMDFALKIQFAAFGSTPGQTGSPQIES